MNKGVKLLHATVVTYLSALVGTYVLKGWDPGTVEAVVSTVVAAGLTFAAGRMGKPAPELACGLVCEREDCPRR